MTLRRNAEALEAAVEADIREKAAEVTLAPAEVIGTKPYVNKC